MKKKYLIYFVLLILFSCNSLEKNENNGIESIDIEQAFDKKEPFNLSRIAKSIEYISLESKAECMTGERLKTYLSKDYIITIAFRQMYLFDRQTGKFVREIGHYGADPEGYIKTIFSSTPYDDENKILYANRYDKEIYGYSFENKLIRRIELPKNACNYSWLDNNLNIAYLKNYTGTDKQKMVIFNHDNPSLKVFPNHFQFKLSSIRSTGWGHYCVFYKYENKLNFMEFFTDTIFEVSLKELKPRHVLKLGKYGPPYEKQQDDKFFTEANNYIIMYDEIFETPNNLFLNFRKGKDMFYTVFDKTEKKAYVPEGGINNDLDNFLPFIPTSVYDNKYLIGFIEAYKVNEWFAKNPELAKKLPDNLKKFKDIDISANPIVMIVELK